MRFERGGAGAGLGLARLARAAVAGPAYEPAPGDRSEIVIAGLALPVRATIALFVATAAFVVDATASPLGPLIQSATGGGDPAMDRAIERAVVFGLVPLLVAVVAFGDPGGPAGAGWRPGRPSRYGLTLGEWRWGVGLLIAGLAVMTPIIWWLSTFPEFVTYYRGAAGPAAVVVLRNLIELVPAEFLLRGFLLFALLRRIGPLAIVVVQVPFVLTHVGKPDIELWSTFLGGSIFAWLNWRTGSILWSALGHVYVLSLMVLLAGAAPG